jgi:hypothetical protein
MRRTYLVIVLLSIAVFPFLRAQTQTQTEINPERAVGDNRAGYFVIAKPLEVSMTVNIWGNVPAQGLYVVPVATDIIQLLSYAGAPKENANLDEVLIFRAAMGKKEGGKLRTSKVINVNEMIEGKMEPIKLLPGDMIVVRKMSGLTWQEVAVVVTTVSSVIILVLQIYQLTK